MGKYRQRVFEAAEYPLWNPLHECRDRNQPVTKEVQYRNDCHDRKQPRWNRPPREQTHCAKETKLSHREYARDPSLRPFVKWTGSDRCCTPMWVGWLRVSGPSEIGTKESLRLVVT